MGKLGPSAEEGNDAVTALPQAGEAHYALSMGLTKLVDSEPEVVKALSLSPFQCGPMVDFAVRYAQLAAHPNRYETALKLLNVVLQIDKDNRGAQIAKAMLLLHLKRVSDAEPVLAELTRRENQAADVQIAAAIYFDIKGQPTASEERLKQAGKIDPENFQLGAVPLPFEFMVQHVRKLHYRGGFYLTPESLYPPKAAPSDAN